jgi:NADH-quinone oxidoreductase subunit H
VPAQADRFIFVMAPCVALAATLTSFLYMPVWGPSAPYAFEGDVIVVLYLLAIPTIAFFLGGWYSRSVFSMIGAARTIMQLFAYEIPLFLSILAPSILAGTWSLSGLSAYYLAHPAHAGFNALGLVVAFVALLGKLERVPFDIPEAETEIVAGSFTEYSGRLLALFRLTIGIETIVGATLLGAVFFPFSLALGPAWGFVLYLVKVFAIVALIALARSVVARLRIDQMLAFCWKVAAPAAFAQVLINLVAKEMLVS